MEEIKALFDEAWSALLKVKKLKKLEDPRKFVVLYIILGVEFLCDTGSTVSLMSEDIFERLGLATEAAKITMTFASFSTKSPYGIVNNLEVGVGNCIIHVYFQVLEMGSGSSMPLIFWRDFLATIWAVVDMPKGIISFANIDENIFYKARPQNWGMHLTSCIDVTDVPLPINVS